MCGRFKNVIEMNSFKISIFDKVNHEEDDGTQWREVPKNKIRSCEDS